MVGLNHKKEDCMKEDLGFVQTWDEAFQKARELFGQGKLDAIATVSLGEFEREQYVAAPLRGTLGTSEEKSLTQLSRVAPQLYRGNERFHLFLMKMPCAHPEYPEGEMWVLKIVYLKPGEQLVNL